MSETEGHRELLLTRRERRTVVTAGTVPVVVVAVAMVALVVDGRLGTADLVLGIVLYGGLLGLTAGVVAYERATAAHCPACGAPGARGVEVCSRCGYDLVRRPVFLCPEGHERGTGPGLCDCGRRLVERTPAHGLGRSIRRSLWAGLWLLGLLVGTAVLLQLAG